MFTGLFGWLRQSVRAAVIGGVQDAITDLTTATPDAPDAPALRLSFTPPTPEADDAPARRKKAGGA